MVKGIWAISVFKGRRLILSTQEENLQLIRGEALPFGQQVRLVIRLSIPAILAEISSIVMQYIDAAMVGSMGKDATASIGLVTSTTWFAGGM